MDEPRKVFEIHPDEFVVLRARSTSEKVDEWCCYEEGLTVSSATMAHETLAREGVAFSFIHALML